MLVIRLSRTGRKKQPNYRVVVTEHTAPIKGKVVEVLGHYNPRTKELKVNVDQAKKRLADGAQPSETAEALLEKAGVLKRDKIIRRPKKVKKQKEEKVEQAPTQIKAEDDQPAADEPQQGGGDEQPDAPAQDPGKTWEQPAAPSEDAPAEGGDDAGETPAGGGDSA